MTLSSRPFLFPAAIALLAVSSIGAQTALTEHEIADAIALGKTCRAPIVHFEAREFDLFVESPSGRAALIAAAAVVNHLPLDGSGVRNAMIPGYRIWTVRRFGVEPMPTLTRISVQRPGGAEIRAAAERRDRLWMGSVPSHGIVDALRTRLPQFEFPSLPSGDYDVVVHTSSGVRRYRVTSAERAKALDVCNKWL